MTDPGVVLYRVVISRWRAGQNSAEIAKTVALTEQQVLQVIWDERAERRRRARRPDPAAVAHIPF